MHDIDDRWVSSVEVDELQRLVTGIGDEASRCGDNLLLPDDSNPGFWGIASGEFDVLDLGHCVHRMHQGHPPPLRGEPADLAGEPIVRVDEVEPALGVGGLNPHDPGGDGA